MPFLSSAARRKWVAQALENEITKRSVCIGIFHSRRLPGLFVISHNFFRTMSLDIGSQRLALVRRATKFLRIILPALVLSRIQRNRRCCALCGKHSQLTMSFHSAIHAEQLVENSRSIKHPNAIPSQMKTPGAKICCVCSLWQTAFGVFALRLYGSYTLAAARK